MGEALTKTQKICANNWSRLQEGPAPALIDDTLKRLQDRYGLEMRWKFTCQLRPDQIGRYDFVKRRILMNPSAVIRMGRRSNPVRRLKGSIAHEYCHALQHDKEPGVVGDYIAERDRCMANARSSCWLERNRSAWMRNKYEDQCRRFERASSLILDDIKLENG